MKSSRRIPVLVLALVVLGGLGFLGWRWANRPKPNLTAALHANLRGVGHAEQHKFDEACDAFEEAIRHAPDWLPARTNLGIALLNRKDKEFLDRARTVLGEVLKKAPNDPHARYSLGMIDFYENKLDDAYVHFDAVSRIDPDDAHTWFHKGMTHPNGRSSAEAKDCFVRALELNPYLNAARYNVAQHPVGRDEKRTKQLLDEQKALLDALQADHASIKYTEMGPYAEVIGKSPVEKAPEVGPLPMFARWEDFQPRLALGTTWAKAEGLLRTIRRRFGAAVVLLDYNGDGRTDIFVASAVMRGGRIGDLLLRNEGKGTFTDVTVEAGLGGGASLGASAADYDNDGQTDLVLTGEKGVRLFRNGGKGAFEDVSKASGLADLAGTFLGAAWVDLDQDSDLDLVLARFRGEGKAEAGFAVVLNVGEAPPVKPGERRGLTTKFDVWRAPAGLKLAGAAVGAVASDLDGDRDLDLLLLADGKAPAGVWNDRLLRFRPAGELGGAGNYNGAVVLDVDHDQRSDLLLLPEGKSPLLWLGRAGKAGKLTGAFTSGVVESPPLLHAQAVDLDRDGWTDVVGLSADRRPVLLHNDGTGKLVHRAEAFGLDDEFPKDCLAALTADLDGDGFPDLLLFSEGKGLEVRRNGGNANRTLRLALSGKRDKGHDLRTNADGVGVLVLAQAGPLSTGGERTSTQAGLGQSMLPMELGLGKHAQADVVRLRWPDGVVQAELMVAAGELVRIGETNRKGSSCPVLFAWDGQRYRFVADILGAGALGEMGPDGSVRPARPEESVRLAPGTLAPRDGWYRIEIAEPMDEVLYLDHLELLVIDHPPEWSVYPDERFVLAGPPPTGELLFLAGERTPTKARNHRNEDLTAVVRDLDRRMVDNFRKRSWLGYAEEHWLELDFGEVRSSAKGDRWVLCLDGWTDYPFPEAIWAAKQAGVEMQAPTLEVPAGGPGRWRAWGELGFPAGLPRAMVRDVTGLVQETARFRIRSNMQVFWDRIRLARSVPEAEWRARARVTTMPVGQATLRAHGFSQEVWPGGAPPSEYNRDRTEAVPVTPWKGALTRLGDVTELLTKRDDRFVIGGPGDAVEVGFDARRLPALPEGWVRTFVLRTAGYTKDTGPFTLTGGEVGPLPYRLMKSFPPPAPPKNIAEALAEYERRWNTRRLGR